MTSDAFFSFITNFGDLAVLLPLTAAILVWLLWQRGKSRAAWWVAACALCMGGTALLKVLFFVCPVVPNLRSPSGHTSLSTLVFGALAILVATKSHGWRRWASVAIGGAFVLAIAASRVLLYSHTLVETALGFGIGAAALGVFCLSYLQSLPIQLRLQPLLVAVALLIALTYGHQLHAEEFLRAIGIILQRDGIACG